MAGTIKRLAGPLFLTNTYTTNVFNDTDTKIFSVIRRIHVANKTAGAVTFRLFLGATGANTAGTELFYDYSVPANSIFDRHVALRLNSTDFLVGGAASANSLIITLEGEQQVV
jgi:hypothetical protein